MAVFPHIGSPAAAVLVEELLRKWVHRMVIWKMCQSFLLTYLEFCKAFDTVPPARFLPSIRERWIRTKQKSK